MKTRLFAALLVLVWSASGYAQTFDTAKLDLLFDRLLEKNKGMGGLTVARDVSCDKTFEGRTPRTDYRLTASGRRALEKYLNHLDAIIRATRSS